MILLNTFSGPAQPRGPTEGRGPDKAEPPTEETQAAEEPAAEESQGTGTSAPSDGPAATPSADSTPSAAPVRPEAPAKTQRTPATADRQTEEALSRQMAQRRIDSLQMQTLISSLVPPTAAAGTANSSYLTIFNLPGAEEAAAESTAKSE